MQIENTRLKSFSFAEPIYRIPRMKETEKPNPPNRVKELRLAKDLTQEGLADLISENYQNIQRIENQKMPLTHWWMEQIAKALKCQPWELIADPEKVYPPSDKRIVHAYRKLKGAKKLAVDEFMSLNDENGDSKKMAG